MRIDDNHLDAKASAKPSLVLADIKTKLAAATQAQYKYIFIYPASLLPPSTFLLAVLSLHLIILVSLYIWISVSEFTGQQCACRLWQTKIRE